jgi:hypothetical protein
MDSYAEILKNETIFPASHGSNFNDIRKINTTSAKENVVSRNQPCISDCGSFWNKTHDVLGNLITLLDSFLGGKAAGACS